MADRLVDGGRERVGEKADLDGSREPSSRNGDDTGQVRSLSRKVPPATQRALIRTAAVVRPVGDPA
ncbi:hypothetical protein [Nitrospira moscoviensis]|uniref:hypothetical protein n=1 Tax=Nitrospira moscoviensis TaxID=42253 RepID=UPI000ADE3A37|nr:hypothetical protein [Nitrospira moscoviensis]